MRGRIIHYNSNEGRGLIATDNRQLPFEIAHWRSDTAPMVNHAVDVVLAGENLESVARVPDEVLLKGKAGELAGKLGAAGGTAFKSLLQAAPAEASSPVAGMAGVLGKPLLIAYALFALSALLLPYISIQAPFGIGGRSFTLAGLSEVSEAMGASVGGALWAWIGILSIALPLLWRSRFAWLALLLPLFATVKPVIDIAAAASKAASAMGNALGRDIGGQIGQQIAEMLHPGLGAWGCALSALAIAGIGLKRVLLAPST